MNSTNEMTQTDTATQIIENMQWRYATKKFDSSKKINDSDFQTLLEVLRLTPSSYGLQPLKFLVIENQEIREKLRAHSWNQSQITDASHLVVLCSYTEMKAEQIDGYMNRTAEGRNIPLAQLEGYGNFVKQKISEMSAETVLNWNAKQAYIALGHLLHSAAQLQIDSTPMEGYDKQAYADILGLAEKGLQATVVCALGYRAEDDAYQFQAKVRKSLNDLVEVI